MNYIMYSVGINVNVYRRTQRIWNLAKRISRHVTYHHIHSRFEPSLTPLYATSLPSWDLYGMVAVRATL